MTNPKPDCNGRHSKSTLDAAIEQINAMGYGVEISKYPECHMFTAYCIGGVEYVPRVVNTSIEEAVLNLLDKLKTVKELG